MLYYYYLYIAMERDRDEEEQALLDIIVGRENDGSQFLNDSSEGMELDRTDAWQTSNEAPNKIR
jgi:hypothetical protein